MLVIWYNQQTFIGLMPESMNDSPLYICLPIESDIYKRYHHHLHHHNPPPAPDHHLRRENHNSHYFNNRHQNNCDYSHHN